MEADEAVHIGRTELSVTRLGLGTAPLGGLFDAVSDEDAVAVVRRSLTLGLRFIDTAPLYGFGISESRVGSAIEGVPRESFALATKVGRLLDADAPVDHTLTHEGEPFFKGVPPLNPVFDFSHDAVLRSIDESLDRLGVDRIDILHIHDPDDHFEQALSGAYPALDRLRSEGVISAIGAGMNQARMLTRLAREADFDCFLLAGRYTLLDQEALPDLLPLCWERGISVIVGGVYNSGILAGPNGQATFDYVPAPAELIERARRLDAICNRHGVPLKAAAIQFPFGHPAVTSVLTGSRSVKELEDNVRMFEFPIPPAVWDEMQREKLLSPTVPVPQVTRT